MDNVSDNGLKLLGTLIRYHRKERGLSLRQLAKISNMSHTLISTIETGKVTPNRQTLKELFKVLEIDFYDSPSLQSEFKTHYNQLYHALLSYEFDKAQDIYMKLFIREEEYQNSLMIVEYNLIKYLYLVMPHEHAIDYDPKLATLESIYDFLTMEQKQMLLFVKGINYVNNRQFISAHDCLLKATKMGDSSLDPFINVFLTYVHVNRYYFMDAIELGRKTILDLEKSMNYKWAMHIRLIIGKAYMLVRRFDGAHALFDQVILFSKQFGIDSLIDITHLYKAETYHLSGDLKRAKEHIDKVKEPSLYYYYSFCFIYGQLGEIEALKSIFLKAKEMIGFDHSYRSRLILEVLSQVYITNEKNSKKYEKNLQELLDIAIRGDQLESVERIGDLLIDYYRNKHQYKKAFEYTNLAYKIRRYDTNSVYKTEKRVV